jgi:hypothetical protein
VVELVHAEVAATASGPRALLVADVAHHSRTCRCELNVAIVRQTQTLTRSENARFALARFPASKLARAANARLRARSLSPSGASGCGAHDGALVRNLLFLQAVRGTSTCKPSASKLRRPNASQMSRKRHTRCDPYGADARRMVGLANSSAIAFARAAAPQGVELGGGAEAMRLPRCRRGWLEQSVEST